MTLAAFFTVLNIVRLLSNRQIFINCPIITHPSHPKTNAPQILDNLTHQTSIRKSLFFNTVYYLTYSQNKFSNNKKLSRLMSVTIDYTVRSTLIGMVTVSCFHRDTFADVDLNYVK